MESDVTTTEKPKRRRVGRDLGPLHALIVSGLPDWIDEDNLLRTRDLAQHLGISYQALYVTFSRKRIGFKHVEELISLSKQSEKRGDDFEELTVTKFAPFLR